MLTVLEANKLIIFLTIKNMWVQVSNSIKQDLLPLTYKHSAPGFRPPKKNSTAPLCAYNRTVFGKAQCESTTPKSSARPAIV